MKRRHADDLRGAARLAVEATKGVTSVVEEMHTRIASGPTLLGSPLRLPVRLLNGIVYQTIRGVTHIVGQSIDTLLGELTPLLGESAPGIEREILQAALNGVLGDHLARTGNPLAIEMRFRDRGKALPLSPDALAAHYGEVSRRLLVMVHGSSMSDVQWLRKGHDHGVALAEQSGRSLAYLHYNSGLHISTNGRMFADALERLVAAWPTPVSELTLVGHSMGGLVARSACHVAEHEGHHWRRKLAQIVTLGTPHHGAPLERGGNWLEFVLGVSSYSAPLARLGRIRSEGVTDLRYGSIVDEDWRGRDRFAKGPDLRKIIPLPTDVDAFAIGATRSKTPEKALKGDGLVPVDSALGIHPKPELSLAFPPPHRFIGYDMDHFDLLDRSAVFAKLREWVG